MSTMSNIDKRFNSSTAYGKSDSEQTQHHLDLGATERASEMRHFLRLSTVVVARSIKQRRVHTCLNCAQAQSCFYCVNQLSPFAVYLVNLLSLTVNTPKKSSLLSPPLCSSNVRVCFHTMRSVSTVRNTFLKPSLSILFRLLHFPVPRFPPMQSGAAFSSPAFSTPAVWCRVFHSRFPPLHFCYSRVFQSRVFSAPLFSLSVTAEALRAKIDWKLAFFKRTWANFGQIFTK